MKRTKLHISFGFLPYLLASVVAVVVFAALMYIEPLAAVIYATMAVSVTTWCLTRTLRKRVRAEMQIKKLCKKEKYRFVRKRRFFSSFKWNTKEPDFILSTGKYTYYVHYLTVSRYRSSLTFENKEGIEYRVTPLNNIFNTAFGAREHKKVYETAFPPLPEESYGKVAVRVILVNPVCNEMFERDPDGGLTSTGSGMEKFGYTVMTVSGFVRSAKMRNDKCKTENKIF